MAEISELINRGFESKDLDYKGPFLWDETDKAACCELVKDVLAMANTKGGFIVIGVSELDHGFEPVGLNVTQLGSFETTRLNQFVQRYSDPPVNSTLSKHELDGRRYAVIAIPPFPDTPHICTKSYPRVLSCPTLYVRSDNNASVPVGTSSDLRQMVTRAMRNREDELLSMIRGIVSGTAIAEPAPAHEEKFAEQIQAAQRQSEQRNPFPDKGYKGYFDFCFYPSEFQAERFTIDELRRGAEAAFVDFRGWPFLFIHGNRPGCTVNIDDGVETLISHGMHGDLFDFWQFRRSGLLFQRKLLWEDLHESMRKAGKVLNVKYTVELIGEAVHCLTRLYESLSLSLSDSVVFRIRILDATDRALVDPESHLFEFRTGVASAKSEMVTCNRIFALSDWSSDVIGKATDMSREVMQKFNWSDPARDYIAKTISNFLRRQINERT